MTTSSSETLNWEPLSKRKLSTWSKLASRKGRQEAGQILVEGVRSIGEALDTDCSIIGIVAAEPEGTGAVEQSLRRATNQNIPLYSTDSKSFAKLSDTVHSAGVVAIVKWSPRSIDALARETPKRVLFCDAISDPGNLGSLIRTAAGLGLHLIVIGKNSVDVTNAKVVRSTAGALFRIPVYADIGVVDFLELSQGWGLHIVLADPEGADEIDGAVSDGWVAVIGGETAGLNSAWPRKGVSRLTIAMHHGVESLNASVAGALLMDRLHHKEGTC
ncbi:MAG: hypothetical protein GF341_01390 [candidate division Zixibacteria bacterium]|nr:hypothetical protein [candidate division Zixibacteria bacterium]